MDEGRLFDMAAAHEPPIDHEHHQARGVAAEHFAAGILLERGHSVASPVTDDDGVDLIVNYRTLVQVKSTAAGNAFGPKLRLSGRRASERRFTRRGLAAHVDVLIAYVRDIQAWWVIPAAEVPAVNMITLGGRWNEWREAWELFD